jgi:gluconolactonase
MSARLAVRYEVDRDGSLSNGRIFVDMTAAPGEDAIDGIKVDVQGNLYLSGPGGLWVISADGQHLGTIVAPRHIHHMAWGDDDGRTLCVCARDRLHRLRLYVGGRPSAALGSK